MISFGTSIKQSSNHPSLADILEKVNIKCEDDRKGFKDEKKSERIDKLLKAGSYHRVYDGKLTKIYSQLKKNELSGRDLVVVSSHIDTVYDQFYFRQGKDVIIGTLDNSITNAVLIDTVLRHRLPVNTVLAFTGNEEKESLGVDETVRFLVEAGASAGVAVSLDVTARGFRNHGYTIENYFIRKADRRTFRTKRHFRNYLLRLLEKKKVKTIHHVAADPDDTWQFDEHDLNCFSFCLPCRSIAVQDDWMHDDIGIVVKQKAVREFQSALLLLMRRLAADT